MGDFRLEDEKYKTLRSAFRAAIHKGYHPGKGIVIDEVDNLMLSSYRLMRHIKFHLNRANINTDNILKIPLLPDALKAAKSVTDPGNGITSLFFEAEKLEALSRSAYRWLKDNKKLLELPKKPGIGMFRCSGCQNNAIPAPGYCDECMAYG